MMRSSSVSEGSRIWKCGSSLRPIGNQIEEFGIGPSDIHDFAFSPDSTLLSIATDDGQTVVIWAISSGQLITKLPSHNEIIRHVLFSPDGKQLVTLTSDSILRIWGIPTTNP